MPVDMVAKYIEFDRRLGGPHQMYGPGYFRRLRDSIQEEGIRERLIIDYDPVREEALLTEGHHRLLVARELGIKEVPVSVMIVCRPIGYSRRPPRKVVGAKVKAESYRECARANFPNEVPPEMVFPGLGKRDWKRGKANR